MGDNGHLQPLSRLPACIMAGKINLKYQKQNLNLKKFGKFNSNLNFY